MNIGVLIDSYKLPIEQAMKKASLQGIEGIQLYMVSGEYAYDKVTDQDLENLIKLTQKYTLKISAVCGDLGGYGFERESDNLNFKIPATKRIIELAERLEVPVVTTHIGVIPEDKQDKRYSVMQKAMEELGRYAMQHCVAIAIETGPEKATVLRSFLDTLTGGVKVNLDPANFVMVTEQDPIEAVYLLSPYIVHTHVKDGKMLKKTSPKIIYDYFAEGGIEDLRLNDYFLETPLGEGCVDFKKYLNALKEVKYDGFLTIEREVGEDPEADIEKAVRFLKKEMEAIK